jgi:hypothetical protein|tara:strand:- start:7455 stop:7703 length:249 start_codon:yes stop_codon:yes gene_type:complete
MSLFDTSIPETPEPPKAPRLPLPPQDTAEQEKERERKALEFLRDVNARGLSSLVLTGGRGVTDSVAGQRKTLLGGAAGVLGA